MLNLGGLFFTLDADTRGLMNAQRRVERFAQDVRSAFRGVSAGTVAPNIANQLARQERAVVSMMERIKRVQNTVSSSGFKGDELKKAELQLKILGNQYDVFTRKMASGIPLNSLDFGRRIQHMTSQINDASRAVNNLQKEALSSRTAWGNATGMLHSFGMSALVVQGHFGGLSTRFIAFGNLVRESGAAIATTTSLLAGLTAGMALLGSHAVQSGRALERLTVGFTALTGNAAVANQELAFTKDVAIQAGLSFEDTAKGYQRFLASARGVISLDQTRQVFRGISLAAATMQLSVEDTQGVFRALDQMMSKGTVQAEELRGQLGDRLPGAFKIAAASMGVSTRALGEMMKKGQVFSSEFVPKFTATLMNMWNIDPTKQIDTLQASLGRLSTEWTLFGQNLDKATGASRLFKEAVDFAVRTLQGLQSILPQALAGIGALAGGFVALAGAMAIQGLVTYITSMWNLVAVYSAATRAVMIGATAVNIFNAALTRFPAAKVIGLIANLVITIGGAVLGYKMMEKAIQGNNAQLNDISAINAYIAAQKAMGFQVATTTKEMQKQLILQQATASAELMKNVQDMNKAAKDFEALQGVMDQGGRAAATAGASYGIFRQKFHDSLVAVREGTKNVRAMEQALRGLQGVAKLPEAPTAGNIGAGGGVADTQKLRDSIDTMNDLILKMQEAESMLQALGNSPGEKNFVEALFEAKRAINGLNPLQLVKLRAALDAAGIGGKELGDRLAIVIARTKNAEDAIRGFNRTLGEIEDASRAVNTFKSQLEFLKSGGDQYGLDIFQDIQDAFERLKDVRDATALKAIQGELVKVGVVANDTGDIMYDTTMALGKFFNQASRTQELVRVWSQFNETTRNANNNLTDLQVTLNGYKSVGVGFFSRIFGAYLGEEVTKALERGRKVEEERRRLLGLGESWENVQTKLQDYLTTLQGIDATTDALQRAQEAANANRDALKSMVEVGTSGIRAIIGGTSKLKDVLLDLANNAMDSLWKRFIDMPIQNFIDGIGKKSARRDAGGIDALVSGLADAGSPGKDDSKAVSALGDAAGAAAGIMKGNLIGALIQSATSTAATTSANMAELAATSAKTALEASNMSQLTMININMALFQTALTQATGALITMAAAAQAGAGASGGSALSSLFGALAGAPGRASGGPMLAGNLYQINEPGVGGEYFIPSVNGYMSRTPPPSGGGSVVIDARTTIDARGASVDAVASLKRELAARDAQLRQELPFMVDERVRSSSYRGRYAS